MPKNLMLLTDGGWYPGMLDILTEKPNVSPQLVNG